jgi:hypothetical protein
VNQSAYVAVLTLFALSLGVLRFASHPRFRVRGRVPNGGRATRVRRVIHLAILASTAGLILAVSASAAGWPPALRWAGAGVAALGWLVAGTAIPFLVRARAAGGSRRRQQV